jgi:DNA-binding PucR family transcriptional regulator
MPETSPHRTLVVANRTAATPLLLEEVKRRAQERATRFALLIPNVESRKHADWTLERATEALTRAAGEPVEGLVGGQDPFESVRRALAEGAYDDVLISTLSKRTSEWLRRDLPSKVEKLGVPVTVISQQDEEERAPVLPGGRV